MVSLSQWLSQWKVTAVTSVFKRGDRSSYNCYRPIGVCDVLAKVAERIISNYMMNHLESVDYFNGKQYGFRKRFSCSDMMLELAGEVISQQFRTLLLVCFISANN
jgi:hypothetical protein